MVAELSKKLDFAQEVRSDRLSGLWKLTLVGGLGVLWFTMLFAVAGQSGFVDVIAPVLLVIVGCIGTRQFLRRQQYKVAVWCYVGGLMAALSLLLVGNRNADMLTTGRYLVAFIFPLIIVMVGLLLPIRATMTSLVICVAITLIVPSFNRPSFEITTAQIFAVFLTCVAAAIAAQMSGELYGIAEWALESYRKEREIKNQLFDSQQEVQRSYMRQKALTDQLQSTNRELEDARAAALEAKNFRGQFLANMSHELRTPLNAIIGFSETMLNFPMMYDNVGLPTAYQTDMTQIYNSGKHLLQLINDILDLSKVDAGKLDLEVEEVDLDSIFKSVLSTAQGLVGEKAIKLKRSTPTVLPHVCGDSLRLRQVILNLMSNAAKFTDSGSITLGARDDGNNEVTVWIADTGIGIAPQDMETIFEEFRQGASGRRKGRAGSGLGLAISKQLLKLMGGRIWVESKLGQGSIFYFTVPLWVPEPVAEHSQS
ncbi:MAG: HAMP domain-containing histidine kinase [Anaerolineae bacterium]|nr:HAMP domain-containing histidine kinase [Anaerolineae bacterium]